MKTFDVVELAKADIWADIESLSVEVGAYWSPNVSAVDAVRDVRRDL